MDPRDGARALGVAESDVVAMSVRVGERVVEFCVERDARRWKPVQRIALSGCVVERDASSESLDSALERGISQ